MRLLLVLLAMLSGLSLPGSAYAVSSAEVVAASAASTQPTASVACPLRAAVARAAYRLERTAPLVLPALAPAVARMCGVIIKVDRARE